MRYVVHDKIIYMAEDGQETELGPSSEIYMDGRQDTAPYGKVTDGFTVKSLPIGDYVFTTQDDRLVVVVEEKKLHDFTSSYRSRRLQRQLRQGWFGADIAVLALRVDMEEHVWHGLHEEITSEMLDEEGIALDLVKWQEIGGRIITLPMHPGAVLPRLRALRAVLKSGRHQLSILAGTDQPRRRQASTPVGQALQATFKGLGPTVADRLAARGGLGRVLELSDDDWRNEGANKTVLEKRRELMG